MDLFGVVTSGDPKYIVMEYAENGSLDKYLMHKSEEHADLSMHFRMSTGFGVAAVCYFASNITMHGQYCNTHHIHIHYTNKGMKYIESLSIVHRDLATRNVLLDKTFTVKVCDFGLSRCVVASKDRGGDDEQGFYKMTHGANIPVRWTAPEALKDQKYTHASDMWSYGVVLWEIWSNGSTPYHGMTNEQVWMDVANGYRLPRPEGCPEDVYEKMMSMWHKDPSERPTFSQVVIEAYEEAQASDNEQMKTLLASVMGEKVEEKTGLLGLSAYHINRVVKKFMKVSKAMSTTDVLSRMKKILKNEGTSYCNWASRQPPPISEDPDGSPGWGTATVFVSHAWLVSFASHISNEVCAT